MKKIILASLMSMSVMVFADTGVLTKVVDGDTLYFKSGGVVKCRLSFIDTPESSSTSKKARHDAEQCSGVTAATIADAGKASTAYVKSLLNIGETYRYETHGKDRYGRSICTVELPSGKSLNENIVAMGYAVPFWKYIPKTKIRDYALLLKGAKRFNAGLHRTHKSVMSCMDRNSH